MKNSTMDPVCSSKKIAYIGPFKFPEGEAGSYRVLGIAQSLREAGHVVQICTGQLSNFFPLGVLSGTAGFQVRYINFTETSFSHYCKVIKYLFSGFRTVQWLDGLHSRPDAILLYGGYSLYAAAVLPWCKRNNVPLIVDVVEWYDPSHLPGGRWGLFHLNVELALRYYFVRAGNIISISQYLDHYFQARGCQTLRIPPTLDVIATAARISVPSSELLILAYTGVPGKKDLLDNVLEAIMSLGLSGKNVLLTVAGVNPDDIIQFAAMRRREVSKLPGFIRALGRVSRDEALDMVRQADFSVLLRPQLRFANAGFPTKIPESLSVGTPVICNLTSDLGEYIRDGENGFICRDHTAEALTEVLTRALVLTANQRRKMREAARLQAELAFDFRKYTSALSEFLNDLR